MYSERPVIILTSVPNIPGCCREEIEVQTEFSRGTKKVLGRKTSRAQSGDTSAYSLPLVVELYEHNICRRFWQ